MPGRADVRAGGRGDRPAAGGGLPALRLRLPAVRQGVAAPAAVAPGARRGAAARSAACRSGCCTTGRPWSACCSTCPSTSPRCSVTPGSSPRSDSTWCRSLRTYPFLRIWNAGCSTGEETYSLAILLREVGPLRPGPHLRHRHQRGGPRLGRGGHLPARQDAGVHRELPRGRRVSGRSRTTTGRRTAGPSSTARSRRTWSSPPHNLVSDRSFNEFHVIVCRNVMIYFDRDAAGTRCTGLFLDSLVPFGVLALGRKETLAHSGRGRALRRASTSRERIYRKRP